MKKLFTLLIATMLCIAAMAQIPTNGLICYYPFTGNANDLSGNNLNGSVNGATLTTDRFGNANQAYSFNGINNYISVNHSILFNNLTNFSFSLWAKWANGPLPVELIFKNGILNNGAPFMLMLNSDITASFCIHNGTTNPCAQSSDPVALNTWEHIAGVYDGNEIKLYFNSILKASYPCTGSLMNNTYNLFFGTDGGTNSFYQGCIDDIRFYNTTLSSTEITALYNETPCYTPTPQTNNVNLNSPSSVTLIATGGTNYKWYDAPSGGTVLGTSASFTTPVINLCDTFYVSNTTNCESVRVPVIVSVINLNTGLIATYPFNGNANDESGNGNDGIVYGATLCPDRNGNANSAYSFNGINSYIQIPNSSSLSPVSAMTISVWVKPHGYYSGSYGGNFVIAKGDDPNIGFYVIKYISYAPNFGFDIRFQDGSFPSISSSTQITLDNWYHIVGRYSGSSMDIFVNGVLENSLPENSTLGINNSDLMIGRNGSSANPYWVNGVIDDIGIWNRALSDSEIQTLYNGVPPTSCTTIAPITTNASRCGAGTLTLNATGGIQYLWYNATTGGNIVNIGPTFNTPTLNHTTTYYVANFDSCESVRVPVIAFINNIVVNAGLDQTIACGDSVLLNATATYNGMGNLAYNWTPLTNVNSPTTLATYVNPNQTTNYNLQVTDGLCTSYDNVTVTVSNQTFGLDFSANQQLIYTPPFAVQFNNLTANLSNYNFTWYFGDGISLQSNNNPVFHQYAQNGLYDVTLIGTDIASGCSQTLYRNGWIYCAGGNNCTQQAIITPTGNNSGCASTPIALSCNTVSGATYQWNYNGMAISGATGTSYNADASGVYSVTIIVNSCPVTSNIATITLNNIPTVPVITAIGTLNYCGGGSVTLTAPAGASSYLWSNGATTQSTTVTISGNYTVDVSNSNGCVAQSLPYLVGSSPLGNPDICLVTVDSITGNNKIIWNKPVTNAINHFNVYGEGNQANVFNMLGSVPYSSLSVFTDVTANPLQQAYRYKLSAVDTCGAETALSNYHKSIHLTINQGMGSTYNLIWSHYEGFTFSSYNIYRGTSPSNMTLLTTIASTLNSFTDLTPPLGYVYYQIEALNPNPCNPSKSIYNSSRSNIASNNLSGINSSTNSVIDFSIYPNPANDNLTIETPQKAIIQILNVQGQLIKTLTAITSKTSIDVSDFPNGVYIIEVKTEKGVAVKKFVKE